LRSRAEYYSQYTRENFVQESDCLPAATADAASAIVEWQEGHVARFLHHLQRGEHQRQWLLKDMHFDDPYQTHAAERSRQAELFQQRALEYVSKKVAQKQQHHLPPDVVAAAKKRSDKKDETDDVWSDDEDDAPSSLPKWYKNPRSGG